MNANVPATAKCPVGVKGERTHNEQIFPLSPWEQTSFGVACTSPAGHEPTWRVGYETSSQNLRLPAFRFDVHAPYVWPRCQ
jgi:hypothetical protein